MSQRNYVIVLYVFSQSMYLEKSVDKNSLDGSVRKILQNVITMWQTNTAFKEPRKIKSLRY